MARSTSLPAAAAALVLAMALPAWGQKQEGTALDPAAVAGAIDRGMRSLKNDPVDVNPQVRPGKGGAGTNELKLLTFIHGGLPESDPVFQELLTRSTNMELRKTYNVSLLAMALEELDRVRHQEKIWQCAQFLVDNMAPNGEWGYGEPTTYAMPATTASAARKPAATAPAPKPKPAGKARGSALPEPPKRVKPPVTRQIPVKKQREGTDPHDNSNTQYAALGLRSAHDAGIMLPREVVERAMKWWRDTQLGSSQGGKPDPGAKGAPVATEGGAVPAGWCYTDAGRAYGSMTVGGVGSLAIYHYILGESWTKDPAVRNGVEWIAQNFSVAENPGKGNSWYYYYLYGMERAGVLYGTETFGSHVWYLEGARELLQLQKPDGSWGDAPESTCFAILFLRRATAPLVASVDPLRKK
jgi:hypothetical protein